MGTVKSIASRMLHGYFISRRTGYCVFVHSDKLTQTILAFLCNTAYYWVDHRQMVEKAKPAMQQCVDYKLCKLDEVCHSLVYRLQKEEQIIKEKL
jgi:hypothetical protein